VFENRVLRRIFGPKRDEVTGDWRKLRNEELHNLYSSLMEPSDYYDAPIGKVLHFIQSVGLIKG
jgi:hypothetical protein